MERTHQYLIEIRGISKRFPGVLALDNVSFKLRPGTVHALMGENGAGKSTLIKCLSGMYALDEGKILLDGKEVALPDVRAALNLGIAVVQQELSPIKDMTVADNIWIGREPKKNKYFIDKKKMYADTNALLKEWDLSFQPTDVLRDYSTSSMQMVEILKAVSRNARVIVLDEPTSSLSTQEVEKLFTVIERLKREGIGIIYISHKMDEIFRIADDITVLRDGKLIASHRAKDTCMDELIREMVGRDIDKENVSVSHADRQDVVLRVANLSAGSAFHNISFELYKGEVLGVSGLIGAGRTELMETIFGLRRRTGGTMALFEKPVTINSPTEAVKHGLAMISEDRRACGIVPLMSVLDNVALATIPKYKIAKIFYDKKRVRADAEQYVKRMRIKTPTMHELIANLSGGNQQKVIIARWLMSQANIFLFDEPTRGIDVGAKSEIHDLIREITAQGKSVIVVSSEMPEILKVSDRIMVMRQGEITAMLERSEANEECIMQHAAIH